MKGDVTLDMLLDLEQQIIATIGSDYLITPDRLRINADSSIRESIESRGWPSVYA